MRTVTTHKVLAGYCREPLCRMLFVVKYFRGAGTDVGSIEICTSALNSHLRPQQIFNISGRWSGGNNLARIARIVPPGKYPCTQTGFAYRMSRIYFDASRQLSEYAFLCRCRRHFEDFRHIPKRIVTVLREARNFAFWTGHFSNTRNYWLPIQTSEAAREIVVGWNSSHHNTLSKTCLHFQRVAPLSGHSLCNSRNRPRSRLPTIWMRRNPMDSCMPPLHHSRRFQFR